MIIILTDEKGSFQYVNLLIIGTLSFQFVNEPIKKTSLADLTLYLKTTGIFLRTSCLTALGNLKEGADSTVVGLCQYK